MKTLMMLAIVMLSADVSAQVWMASPPVAGQTCRIWSLDPANIQITCGGHWSVELTAMGSGEGPSGYFYDWYVNETSGDPYTVKVNSTTMSGDVG